MLVQKLLVLKYLPRIPIRHDETLIHHDRVREQLLDQFHIVRGDQHGDRQSLHEVATVFWHATGACLEFDSTLTAN